MRLRYHKWKKLMVLMVVCSMLAGIRLAGISNAAAQEAMAEMEEPAGEAADESVEETAEEASEESEEEPYIVNPRLKELGLDNPVSLDAAGSITVQEGELLDIRVPEYLGEEMIHTIGEGAFAGKDCLHSVTIPASVTTINANAFADCPNLAYIVLEGRADGEGLIVGENWNGNAEVIYGLVERDSEAALTAPENTVVIEGNSENTVVVEGNPENASGTIAPEEVQQEEVVQTPTESVQGSQEAASGDGAIAWEDVEIIVNVN